MQSIKILHLNSFMKGGAAEAAYRLHLSFKKYGYDSKMLVAKKTKDDSDIIQVQSNLMYYLMKIEDRLFTLVKSGKCEQSKFFWPDFLAELTSITKIIEALPFKPDIIIAHWIARFLTQRHLYQLNKYTGAPLIWHLLDMNPLTGGCHYSFECDGYKKKCGNCPVFNSKKENDYSRYNWEKKLHYITKTDISLVSTTSFIDHQLNNSTLFKDKRSEKIMLGIDPDIFKPVQKYISREKFNLPLDKKIVFFGAQSIEDKRKGMEYLLKALESLYNELDSQNNKLKDDILVLIAGSNQNLKDLNIPFKTKYIGYIKDNETLAAAYQAVDLYVCPSIEDTGPMMISESIMSGTPVVSFEMGAAFDLVHTGRTGYRAKFKDILDLGLGIKTILEMNKNQSEQMSKNCRELGLELCHPKLQVQRFENIFNKLLNRAGS